MIKIIKHVVPVAQKPGSNDCWAACTAMMLNKTGQKAIDEIVANAKAKGVPLQDDNRLDPNAGVGALARCFGFKQAEATFYVKDEIPKSLKNGPFTLFGFAKFTWAKWEGHAVVIHGWIEHGNSQEPTILGVDPRGFTAINMPFNEFTRVFEPQFLMYK